jgi:nucleoside phosphorylase
MGDAPASTLPHIPTYFSHSYRRADREVNLFFWRLFCEHGFFFAVDPKSTTLSAPYLEYLIQRASCFVSVLVHRSEQPRYRCSPFLLFEYGLAVRARKPRLIFVEQGVPGRFFPTGAHTVIPFNRQRLEDDRKIFTDAIQQLAAVARPNRRSDVALRGKVGILLAHECYGPVKRQIHEIVENYGFKPEDVDVEFEHSFEFTLRMDEYDLLVLEVGPQSDPSWIYPFVHARFIPSVKLCHVPHTDSTVADRVPKLVKEQLFESAAATDEPVILWQDSDALLKELDRQLARFDRTRTELHDLQAGEKYFRSLGRSGIRVFISNASEANEFARLLSARLDLENIPYFHYKSNNTIPLGSDWSGQILDEINRSTVFVALITRSYGDSAWSFRELQRALQMAEDSDIKLIPYFLDDARGLPDMPQGRDLRGLSEQAKVEMIVADLDELSGQEAAPLAREGAESRRSGDEPVDVALVTIIPEEYAAVLACLDQHWHPAGTGESPNQYGWQLGEITARHVQKPYRVVVALASQAGNVSSAMATIETVQRWSPRYVVLLGIAGGLLRKEMSRGDLAISSVIWGYEYGKIDDGFVPRGDFTYVVDRPLLTAAQTMDITNPEWRKRIAVNPPAGVKEPKLFAGAIGSGDKVMDDASDAFFQAVLQRWPKLIAVEMEGAGAAAAIQTTREKGQQAGFIMVRGISDLPRWEDAPDSQPQTAERDTWKRYASAAAATFVTELIRQRWPVPPRSS